MSAASGRPAERAQRPARSRCRVALVDAGGANLASVRFALQRLGAWVTVTADPAALRTADRVILPGVGAAAPGMRQLRTRGLDQALRTLEVPLLGICLGMQLLYEHSAEGDTACLGLLPGRVAALPAAPGVRIPHMGWNALQRSAPSRLLQGIGHEERFYFVHSFAGPAAAPCTASARHGTQFAAVAEQGRVAGVQFHPERSGAAGARLLGNFLAGGAA
jgi:glutamine amidotransferase